MALAEVTKNLPINMLKHLSIYTLWQIITEIVLVLLYPVASILTLFVPVLSRIKNPQAKTTIIIAEQWLAQNLLHYWMKRKLERRGYRVYMFNFSVILGGVDDGGEKLKEFIEKKNIKSATLVGFSMGAIASIFYLQKFEGWKKINKFISLSGPFDGTPVAYPFILLKSARQVLPHSVFLRNLTKHLVNAHKIICVSAKVDEIVPCWSSRLAGTKNITIPILGHANLLVSSNEKILDIIDRYAK